MKNIPRGIFILFEGGEKVGKSTQVKLVDAYFKKIGYSSVVSREPGGGDPNIRQKLLHSEKPLTAKEELALFCEDRRLHVENFIIPALNAKKIVLLDRFEPSSIAYQGYGRGLSVSTIRRESAKARQGIWPDLIILLDADPEFAHKRAEATTRFDKEGPEFHLRLREGFLAQAKKDPKRWRIIDASLTEKQVFLNVVDFLKDLFFREFGINLP